MPSTAILHEVQRLHGVSDRLDALADQHPIVSEALLSISVSVRNTATLLEVLPVLYRVSRRVSLGRLARKSRPWRTALPASACNHREDKASVPAEYTLSDLER